MREIKFRAWHAELGMSEVFGLETDLEAFPEAIMQNTGLKDKNGKEIYEGDIVRFNALSPMSDIPDRIVGKVEFSECTFWVLDDFNRTAYRLFTTSNEWEVIGNIYENPELVS